MEDLRINALMTMLGLGEEEMENIEISSYSDKVVAYYNEEYLVVTEEEADEEFRDFQQSLIDDMGLEAFSKWAQQYIINNFCNEERLSEYIREDCEIYVGDIKYEGNRLEKEMEEVEVETEEEYIDYLCEEWEGKEVDYFTFNFGEQELSEIVKGDDTLINWDDVIDWVEREDGRECLASYDGKENEIEIDGEVMYIYRTN